MSDHSTWETTREIPWCGTGAPFGRGGLGFKGSGVWGVGLAVRSREKAQVFGFSSGCMP